MEGWTAGGGALGCVVGGARRGAEAGLSRRRPPAAGRGARGSGLRRPWRGRGQGSLGVPGRAHAFPRSAAFWPWAGSGWAGLGERSPEERVS